MRKIRMWCAGGDAPLPEERTTRGKHIRCAVCGQRFLPKQTRSPEDGEVRFQVPPHKAY